MGNIDSIDDLDDLELARICGNCVSFYPDPDDLDYGVCLQDEEVDAIAYELFETNSFEHCPGRNPWDHATDTYSPL